MQKIILFIHGWSEDSHCFSYLQQMLFPNNSKKYQINLADFVTLDDTVTFTDLVAAMQQAWTKHNLPVSNKDVDIVTHSTGALVLRAWLRQYYPRGNSPIERVVMLAPPNFGSHIAHKGAAFYGRIYKGLNKQNPFEVGENLLKDLEIGSEFTQRLAEFDCFSGYSSFQPNDIMVTILIGGSGYDGFASVANVPCSDGVVPIPLAQLEPKRLKIRYDSSDKPYFDLINSTSQVACKIIPSLNHSSILTGEGDIHFSKILHEALTVSSIEFLSYRVRLMNENKSLGKEKNISPYQKTLVNVTNQFSENVNEYFIAFAAEYGRFISNMNNFHDELVKSVHCNTYNSSVRCFTLDTECLFDSKDKIDISIIALPCLDKKYSNVGYRAHDVSNEKALVVTMQDMKNLLEPYSLLMLDWQVVREFKESLFRLHVDYNS